MLFSTAQSVSGASVWSDGKDKQDQAGQLSTWDVDTFIKVVRELAPHINFKEVVFELDHQGFYIGESQGLRLVKTALIRGLQQDVFPVEALYRVWKNFEGQVSCDERWIVFTKEERGYNYQMCIHFEKMM